MSTTAGPMSHANAVQNSCSELSGPMMDVPLLLTAGRGELGPTGRPSASIVSLFAQMAAKMLGWRLRYVCAVALRSTLEKRLFV